MKFETLDPGRPQSVPLFLALHLIKLNLCHIRCPGWIDPDHLNKILIEEKQSMSTFAPGLPIFYYEIFQALDAVHLSSIQECRRQITCICLLRCQKIRSKQITDFQHAGSAEIKFNRMIILGSQL